MKKIRNMHIPQRLLALVMIFAIMLGVPVPAMAAQPPTTANQWNPSTIWQERAVDVDMDVASDGTPYAAFTMGTGELKVCYYQDSDYGWVGLGDTNITDAADDVAIKVYDSTTYRLVWVAYKTKSGTAAVIQCSYQKNSTNTWTTWHDFGTASAAGQRLAEGFSVLSVDTDSTGSPYIAYATNTINGYLTWSSNGSWVTPEDFVNVPGVGVTSVSLDVTNDDTPYVAYAGSASSAVKYRETSGSSTYFETVGGSNLSGDAYAGTLVDMQVVNGTSYVMYVPSGNKNKLYVLKTNSEGWWEDEPSEIMASADISAASLYVTAEGTPYVAYCSNGSVRVVKYISNAWEVLGSPISQTGGQISLHVESDGTAMLSYIDSETIYPTCQIYSLPSAEANIISVNTPANAAYDNDGTYSATVTNSVVSQLVDVTVSDGASWALYSDAACEQEIYYKTMSLIVGANTAYIKVTAENNTTQKYTLTITREAVLQSDEKSVTSVTMPTGAVLDNTGCTVTATVANEVTSQQINVTVSNAATWALYSDSACEQEIDNKTLNLNVGANIAYIKVTAENGTTQKYTITITREATPLSSEKSVIGVTMPTNAVLDTLGRTVTATVANDVTSQQIDVTVSNAATWALYSDSACEQEIDNKTLNLNVGANTAYIKVTAENGTTQKYTITITREATPLSSEKSVIGVTMPTDAVLDTLGRTVTATVANDVTSQQIDVTVSNAATWALYSDSACEQEIGNKTLNLNVGANTAYIKVTAEDGTTQKYIITIRREDALTAPTITTQPVNQTVIEGQTVAFTVAAAGDGPLFYQWRKDGADIAGATSSTLTIYNANPSDAGSYSCYVSNEVGNVTSNAATLTVNLPGSLVLTAVPGDQNITLTWNNISEADSYSVYKDNLLIETVSGSAINVTGLTNGTSYSFEVKALDSQMSVLASSGQISATPVTIPGIPTGITAIAGNSQATVSFTPPLDNGGSPITGYIVTSSPGNITAAGSGTTITVPGLSNGITYTFTVKAINAAGNGTASAVSNAVTPQSPSGSGSSGGGTTPVAQDPSGVTQIVVDVKQGNTDSTVSRITVERSTGSDGKKTDTVTYQEAKAEETVKKLKEENKDTARIVIPDEKDEVSQTKVNVPAKALEVLAKGGINLQIDTEEAKIDISKNTIAGISQGTEEDLYFWLVPVKDKAQRETVINQALLKAAIVSGNTNSSISIVGNPVTIETNMSSTEADITLPLTGITLPSDSAEKAALLQQLGIRFHINKFSTFTVVKTDAFLKSSNANILKVIAPSASTIKGSVITASVANKTDSVTVKLKVNDKAVWKLYKDKNCTKAVAQNKLNLVTGTNISYVKVTADDGTFKVYKLTINREYSTAADILKVSTPAKARVKGKTVTAAVANETASVKINLRVSDKATWKLYSDKACTKEIANHK
ncbi:MAG: hypothetical protein K0S04_1565, partial [Herbinix sp.]|nr:hypothetical protein [Herbinix sp.]